MPLDVLVAGMIPPADAPADMRGVRLPALEKWLARGEIVRDDSPSAYDWLARRFGIAGPPPVAAIELAESGERPAEAWLRADPVHIRMDRDARTLHAGATLEIRDDEARALVEALQGHFRDEPLQFRMVSAERWYASLPLDEVPATTPLDEALGQGVRKAWPAGRGRIPWPSALTEIQMLLSTNESNAGRERDGRPAVNSVWFWGGGALPATLEAPYARVHADDPFTRGLAALTGARLSAAPARLRDLDADGAQAVLVASDAPLAAIRRASVAGWAEALRRLDRDWFADLGELVPRFGVVRVILTGAAGTLVASLSSAARWRFFSRRKPLSAYA